MRRNRPPCQNGSHLSPADCQNGSHLPAKTNRSADLICKVGVFVVFLPLALIVTIWFLLIGDYAIVAQVAKAEVDQWNS
jgi:hypothetical protein